MPEYGICQVKRKSDNNWNWKRAFNLSKVRISNNLMINGLNITKILKYFKKNVCNKRYLEIPKGWETEKLLVFVEHQKAKIDERKKMVNEEWRRAVENIFKENKIFKDQLVLYFKSVTGVMSTQLRKLIVSTIQDFYKFILKFKKKSYFDPHTVFNNQFKPSFPFQYAFLELDIILTSDGFDFSEGLSDIHNKLINLLYEVIKASQDVERPDNTFIKNPEKKANLWDMQTTDHEVIKMINEIDSIFKDNLDVINKVFDLYQAFNFIHTEEGNLDLFKAKNPTREEFKKKIKFYEEKLNYMRE